METLALPSTERSAALNCSTWAGVSGTADVTAAVVSPRRRGKLGQEGRGHRRQLTGAAVGGHSADKITRQTGNARGIQHGQQRLALQVATNDRARDQAGEVGTFANHRAKCGEILSDLIERLGIVRQLKKGAGIASGNAGRGGGCGRHVENLSPAVGLTAGKPLNSLTFHQ